MDDKDFLIIQLLAENKELKETIKQLQERIVRLEKNSKNSSKPPSSDIVKPKRKVKKSSRKKRKRGGQPGHQKFSRPAFKPEDIDEVIEYEFYAKDAVGLEPLDEWHVIQQVTLPEKLYVITEHRARKYLDPQTGTIHITPLPSEVNQGHLLGADLSAMIAFMKGGCHMSFSTIQQFCKEVMQLSLSRGVLDKAKQKVSQALQPTYDSLVERLPYEMYLGVDETGHKNNGDKHWTWCFQTLNYTLFHIDKSRGSQVLFELLGEDFNGILNCDYYGSYRKFSRLTDATVQYCMAHLIREIRFLAEHSSKRLARWGQQLLDWIKKLFDTLHRHDRLTAAGFTRSMTNIKKGFLSRIRRPPNHRLAKALARRFKGKAAEAYFQFMTDPHVEPTNNGTEREIRHTVIDRRITQGTRGDNGMRWCERIWTVIATCKKQHRNVFEFIHQTLLAHWNNTSRPGLV
jgi:transposase